MGVGGRERKTSSFLVLTLVGYNEWKEFNPMKVMKLNPCTVVFVNQFKELFLIHFIHARQMNFCHCHPPTGGTSSRLLQNAH